MMCPHHASPPFGFAIPPVWNLWTKRTVASRPVVVRNDIEVLIKCGLRLLLHNTEDLRNSDIPILVRK